MTYDTNIINEVSKLLVASSLTISVAESVTSGLLQNALASAQNATVFFQGGVTAYNIKQKTGLLHIDPLEAVRTNCVSASVASQMALGVARIFRSTIAVGVTGYATPVEGHTENGLFAFCAIAFKNKILDVGLLQPGAHSDAMCVQIEYVDLILDLLCRTIVLQMA